MTRDTAQIAFDQHVPGFATLAVHAGAQPDASRDARGTPTDQAWPFDGIDHAAAVFGQQVFGTMGSRMADPACAVLEERVAALEGGTAAVAVASGAAARQAVFHPLMQPGDEFIAATGLSSGSVDQFDHAFKRFGWQVRWADPADPDTFAALVTDRTRAIVVEALPAAGGIVTDVAAIGAVAKRARVPLVVDNTLASPYLVRPFAHGADIVVHSATHVLCGHGHSTGGVIIDGGTFDWMADERFPALSQSRPDHGGLVLGESFGNFAFATAVRGLGPSLTPFDAVLILTGIETLPLRMRCQCDNALAVATHLAQHPAVARVSYPGLPDDPNHALAQRYCPEGAGAVFTFGLRSGRDSGVALVERLKLFSQSAGVGGTRSRASAGPETVRLSIGIEDAADLIADLDQALAA